jgi:hypothetical protein
MAIKKNIYGISIPAALITIFVIVILVAWALMAEKKSSAKHHSSKYTGRVILKRD